MNVLILGGESPRHYEWVRQVATCLKPHFDNVLYLDYRHWSTGEPSNIDYEIGAATELSKDLSEYVIVAKSIGTVIATLGTSRGRLHPTYCVFLGLPLGLAKQVGDFHPALQKLPSTVIVQNDHDPIGAAEDVKEFINTSQATQITVQTVEGDTHDYVDMDLIAKLAAKIKRYSLHSGQDSSSPNSVTHCSVAFHHGSKS